MLWKIYEAQIFWEHIVLDMYLKFVREKVVIPDSYQIPNILLQFLYL